MNPCPINIKGLLWIKRVSVSTKKKKFPVAKVRPKYLLAARILGRSPRDPRFVKVIHANEGDDTTAERTEPKFNKHLPRRGLPSLEINGVLNKRLLLEQCQCQREFAVKENAAARAQVDLPSRRSVLSWG